GNRNTQNLRSGEAEYRTQTEAKQDKCRDELGDVPVQYGCIRTFIAIHYSLLMRFAYGKLFFNPFKYQYVGIHRHTETKHQARYTRQRKRGMKCGKHPYGKQQV